MIIEVIIALSVIIALVVASIAVAGKSLTQIKKEQEKFPLKPGDAVLSLETYRNFGIFAAGRYRIEDVKEEDGEFWVQIQGVEYDQAWFPMNDFMLMSDGV